MKKTIKTIETHTFGQPTRVIDGGLISLAGSTMKEKRDDLAARYDYLRTALMQEPRGHRDMFGALITQPTLPEADFGVIFMDNSQYLNMSGHSVIGAITALISAGWVQAKKPLTKITLETPAGLIHANAYLDRNGSVKSVSFRNVPGFLHYQDIPVQIPGLGDILIDIAYGGNYLAFVPAKLLGLKVEIKSSRRFKFWGKIIKDAINAQVSICHPEKDFINSVDIISFYSDATVPNGTFKIVNVYSDAQVDRSPGGTGTAAWVARLYGRKELALDEEIHIEGFIGGLCTGKAVEEVPIAGYRGVVAEICGRAHLMGVQSIILDDNDPFRNGFMIE